VDTVGLYNRYEISFRSEVDYDNPQQDIRVVVHLNDGRKSHAVEAFWDGDRIWRARFAPPRCGQWTWLTASSNARDHGLNGQAGHFDCAAVATCNPILTHGPLQIAESRTYLTHADGTPFFWLGDTAWNGPLKSNDRDWETYLADRQYKGFNGIQFVATQWISAVGDAEARPAYLGNARIRIEPSFFQRLDRRVDMINAFGMVAAPVLAWAAAWNPDSIHLNPGNSLPEDQLIVLIRYLVSRYGGHQVIWILAGDGIYEGEEAERWRRIGRASLEHAEQLVTVHPGGKVWVAPEFRNEPWFHFNSYQSGHWNDEDNARWINQGPLSLDWSTEPVCPHINFEPVYEDHKAMTGGKPINALDVRRASYWSLLAAPPAGISYGAHGVWSWESTPGLPLSHPHAGIATRWDDALHFAGSTSMASLKTIFDMIQWWRLVPSPQLLTTQPGTKHPLEFISAACSPDRDLVLIYLPHGGAVSIQSNILSESLEVACFDPSSGTRLWKQYFRDCGPVVETGGGIGDSADRLLLMQFKQT
jgi:hypothetical protein